MCVPLHTMAQHLDPAFEKAHVERLFSQPSPGLPFHPQLFIPKPELSFHQRFAYQINLIVDGRELPTRHKGDLYFFCNSPTRRIFDIRRTTGRTG